MSFLPCVVFSDESIIKHTPKPWLEQHAKKTGRERAQLRAALLTHSCWPSGHAHTQGCVSARVCTGGMGSE